MFCFPSKHRDKAIARTKGLRRRRFIARLLIFLFLLFGLGATSTPPKHALLVELNRLTARDQFDFVDWEIQAIAGEIKRRWSPPLLPDNELEQHLLVQTFLNQEQYLAELEDELNKLYVTSAAPIEDVTTLSQALAINKASQDAMLPQVETILAQQVEAILKEEGFTKTGPVFPPVAFRLIEPPTALILSPRRHIEKQQFLALKPGLDHNRRAEIERTLDQRGDISSYITDIGGLGSYPTMVITHAFLPYLIDVIAHEWTHNYLFTFPTNIAWGYQTYPRLATINETTASLVGGEISRKVILRFYPDWVDQLPPVDGAGQLIPQKPSEFHSTMRHTRQQVDRLLAEGRIEEAEEFMETERLKLVAKGYNLRKLNQAYFAFHGAYTLSPGSIDPTGPQIRQLRASSPSLKAFLDRVGWLNSYEDYLAWLTEAGIGL